MEGPEIKAVEAVIDNGSFGKRTLRFETGRLAQQADGAVAAYLDDDSMILSTTTAGSSPKENYDFFPLTVDVEEKMYAAGRIPGQPGSGQLLHQVRVDIEVGMHLLHVIVIFEIFQEFQQGYGNILLGYFHRVFRDHRQGRLEKGDTLLFKGFADIIERLHVGQDLEGVLILNHVLGTGLQRLVHQFLLGDRRLVHQDLAFFIEHPGHTTVLAKVPVALGKVMSHIRHRPIPVIGHAFHQYRHSARPVTLVEDLFVNDAVAAPRTLGNGSGNIVLRHVFRLGCGYCRT